MKKVNKFNIYSKEIQSVQNDYYMQTTYDYHIVWDNTEFKSAHFGIYNEHASKHHDALVNTNRVLADLSGIKASEDILDAGCGWGSSSFWLAKYRSANVVGITPVKDQIDMCKIKVKEIDLAHLTKFVCADFCKTEFEDNSFDVVWAIDSVCHANNKRDFYTEAFRLLKPGGRLIVAEYIRNGRNLRQKDERLIASWLRNHAIPDIDTKEEHFKNIRETGFSNINIEDYTAQVMQSVKNLHEKSIRCLPIESVLRLFRFRTAIQHGNLIGSLKIWYALKKNLWFYSIITGQK